MKYKQNIIFLLCTFLLGCSETSINSPPNEPEINLTFPKGGEELILSEIPVTIEWSSNNVQKVNLFYSTFIDTSWILIADSINSEQGSYNWDLPYIISDNYNLKITDCDNDNVFDITDNPFSIIVEQNIIEVIKYYPLNIGNKWVYKVRFRQTVFPPLIDTTYFFKREVIADTTTGDGKVYYIIEEIVYYNNNIKTYYENIDLKTGNIYRRYINNEFEEVLIDSLLAKVGDQFISHRFTNQNSNYYMYTEFLSTEFVEYFGTVRITKKFRELDTFAFYDYFLVENIGLGNFYHMLDVASQEGNLVGCFIEGIVYGDTTITY